MTEYDTVLESIEASIADAYREFGQNPTNSARVKLRGRLVTLSSALEIEAYADNVTAQDRATLQQLSKDLSTLAEAALIAPVSSLINDDERVQSGAKKQPVQRSSSRKSNKLFSRIISDMLKGFLK